MTLGSTKYRVNVDSTGVRCKYTVTLGSTGVMFTYIVSVGSTGAMCTNSDCGQYRCQV